ncbi:hypothetical protein QBC38DRAFT_424170 [Podospora fimiseda]|uniref:Uncharacterized protein n=1 Tax=Podospora fimiseda TaxID=252190 RepID=A0AAN7GTA4_9PEZI|nr:hypothetical protein QBC38DRAFT_424170 [Podospora fimiseda]
MTNHIFDRQVPNGTTPTSEQPFHDFKLPDTKPPPYEDIVIITSPQPPLTPLGPPKLHILSATWGGVLVTPEIQLLIKESNSEPPSLSLNMHTIHTKLIPDPGIGVVKSLSLLYQYSDSLDIHLLNIPQFAPQISHTINHNDHFSDSTSTKKKKIPCGLPQVSFASVNSTAWKDPQGKVEILAVVYGMVKVENPSVLEEMGRFFRGERGQIRTTAEFFRASSVQAFVGPKNTWTVWFRLLGDGVGGKVRCVTGWGDGALEVP